MNNQASTPELFKSWRAEMGNISVVEAAKLLGKQPVTAYKWQSGQRNLTKSTLMLMKALAAGFRPSEAA